MEEVLPPQKQLVSWVSGIWEYHTRRSGGLFEARLDSAERWAPAAVPPHLSEVTLSKSDICGCVAPGLKALIRKFVPVFGSIFWTVSSCLWTRPGFGGGGECTGGRGGLQGEGLVGRRHEAGLRRGQWEGI